MQRIKRGSWPSMIFWRRSPLSERNDRGADAQSDANRYASTCRLLVVLLILFGACSGGGRSTPTGPATPIVISAGNNQIAASGAAVSQAPSVRGNDANGNAGNGV